MVTISNLEQALVLMKRRSVAVRHIRQFRDAALLHLKTSNPAQRDAVVTESTNPDACFVTVAEFFSKSFMKSIKDDALYVICSEPNDTVPTALDYTTLSTAVLDPEGSMKVTMLRYTKGSLDESLEPMAVDDWVALVKNPESQ